MKYLLFSYFFSIASFSQDIKNLDIYNGYKKLKFDMNISQIENIELNNLYNNNSLSDEIYYDYIGNDLKYFGNIKIEKTTISFIKNRLSSIQIQFGNPYSQFSDFQVESIKELLISNFGNKYVNCQGKTDVLNCLIWDADNVRCELIRVKYSNNNYQEFNNTYGYILYTNKLILK